MLPGLWKDQCSWKLTPARTCLLLRDQVKIQGLGYSKSFYPWLIFTVLQNIAALRYSTIARCLNRIPLPKYVMISAPNTFAIYSISLNLSNEFEVFFLEKESFSRDMAGGQYNNHLSPFVNRVLSVELRGDSSSSDHLSASSPTAKIVSPSKDCLIG